MHPMIRETLEDTIARLRATKVMDPHLYPKTFARLLDFVRCELDEAREELTREPVIEAAPAIITDFAGICDYLRMARSGLMQYGASDAQINLIAGLAVEQGLSADQLLGCNPGSHALSKREASAIITDMKK